MNDKKRPIEERLAALFGRSAFCDVRDGVGGTSIARLSDQDIAAALGCVIRRRSRLAVQVLETACASTMTHAAVLRREWEDHRRKRDDTREQKVLTRFGGELAVRELAGMRCTSTQYAEYAYLICSRRESLQDRVTEARGWFGELREGALASFRAVVADPDLMDELRQERSGKRAA